jgi:hypothetical protein
VANTTLAPAKDNGMLAETLRKTLMNSIPDTSHAVDPRLVLAIDKNDVVALFEHLGFSQKTLPSVLGNSLFFFLEDAKAFISLPTSDRYVSWIQIQAIRSQLAGFGLMEQRSFDVWLARHQKEILATRAILKDVGHAG